MSEENIAVDLALHEAAVRAATQFVDGSAGVIRQNSRVIGSLAIYIHDAIESHLRDAGWLALREAMRELVLSEHDSGCSQEWNLPRLCECGYVIADESLNSLLGPCTCTPMGSDLPGAPPETQEAEDCPQHGRDSDE